MINVLIVILLISAAQGQKCLFPDCQCIKSADLINIICWSSNNKHNGTTFPKRDLNVSSLTLISIEFNGYQVDQLPDSIFTNLTIYELRLINNSIQSINNATFNGIRSLNTLTIIEPELKRIDENAFLAIRRTLRKLQITSNMSDCTLDRFVNSFKPLSYLSELNLGGNRLTGLNPNISVVLPNIAILHLVANEIKHLDSKSFANFRHLSELYLDLNKINDLAGLISSLEPVRHSLSILRVSQNLIQTLTDFPLFPRLIQLSLDGNLLNSVGATHFKYLTPLQVLELGQNMINSIEPGSLSNLFVLETLGLGGNQLTSVPGILSQVNLKYIFLNDQAGSLFRWIDDYSFDRLVRPFWPLTIYLDGNEGVNFGNHAFCSNYVPYIQFQELILTLSSAVNFNKCLFKQLGGGGALKSFTIVEDRTMRSEYIPKVCNCEFIRFAAYYGIQVQGVCDSFSDSYSCTDYRFQDDCSKDFDCLKNAASSNSIAQTTTTHQAQTVSNHTISIMNSSTITGSSTKNSTTIPSAILLTHNKTTQSTTAVSKETSSSKASLPSQTSAILSTTTSLLFASSNSNKNSSVSTNNAFTTTVGSN